jgi:hypothetical protein
VLRLTQAHLNGPNSPKKPALDIVDKLTLSDHSRRTARQTIPNIANQLISNIASRFMPNNASQFMLIN